MSDSNGITALVDLTILDDRSELESSLLLYEELFNSFTCLVQPKFLRLAESHPRVMLADALDPIRVANAAIDRAVIAQQGLLVVAEPLRLDAAMITSLLASLVDDPLLGFAVPRVATSDGLRPLGVFDTSDVRMIALEDVAELPPTVIVPEFLSSTFLVRDVLIANLGALDERLDTVGSAWLKYMVAARRIGYRHVVCNRVVCEALRVFDARVPFEAEDFWRVHRLCPDIESSRKVFAALPVLSYERLVAEAGFAGDGPRELLIDARGMRPFHNGTSECILGVLDGLSVRTGGWRLTVLCDVDSASYHRVSDRYPRAKIVNHLGGARYCAALRLSQPWDIETIAELHSCALFVSFLMLDCISWDIIYPVERDLTSAWNFAAQYSDGLLYISEFSQDRFRRRFPVHASVLETVSYLSFRPEDYVRETSSAPAESAQPILIVGNGLDHKFIPQTVEAIASAFPFERIVALGLATSTLPRVSALESGLLTETEIDALYASARLIVFPSFYEGFGFPIVKGLSHGRRVLAREGALLDEVARNYCGPGSLYKFSDPLELITSVRALLHGDESDSIALGSDVVDGQSLGWLAIADRVLAFTDRMASTGRAQNWLRRHAVLQLIASRGSVARGSFWESFR